MRWGTAAGLVGACVLGAWCGRAAIGSGADVPSGVEAPKAAAAPAAQPADERMEWWRDARLGMFIHWGLYAVPAGEWKDRKDYGEWIMSSAHIPVEEYEKFAGRFNPVKFDADAWVRMAKNAGMKYIVITSKHHDGFALFDSKVSDYDVMATPFKRDILKELSEACAKAGIKMCWYHSIMDWHHPDYLPRRDWETRSTQGADFDRYVNYMKGQLRELLTNYGPIGVLWFDGQWEGTWSDERGRDLYAYVRGLQPNIIINNRVGRGGGDWGLDREQSVGDFGTPEQHIPDTGMPGVDWETCMTMNDHWGYCRADKNFKTTEDLIRKLADIASKGGNFLLNVGPTAEGEIPGPSVERLAQMGEWMKVNGESIYGTQASPFAAPKWGRCTQKDIGGGRTRLYLHVFDWPADGKLEMESGLLNEIVSVTPLGASPANIKVVSEAGKQTISLGMAKPDPINSVLVMEIIGKPDVAVAPIVKAETTIFTEALDVAVTTGQENVDVRYTTDGAEPTAASTLLAGPIRLTQTTEVKARAFRDGRAVSPVGSGRFEKVRPLAALLSNEAASGLRYEYFEGDFKKTSEFDAAQAASRGVSKGFDLSIRQRDKLFGVRYVGCVRVPQTGVYRFYTRSDDGSKLMIGDQVVVDNDGPHSPHEESGVIALAAGLHPITVSFFENTGGHELRVMWSGPGLKKEVIPAAVLVHKESR